MCVLVFVTESSVCWMLFSLYKLLFKRQSGTIGNDSHIPTHSHTHTRFGHIRAYNSGRDSSLAQCSELPHTQTDSQDVAASGETAPFRWPESNPKIDKSEFAFFFFSIIHPPIIRHSSDTQAVRSVHLLYSTLWPGSAK